MSLRLLASARPVLLLIVALLAATGLSACGTAEDARTHEGARSETVGSGARELQASEASLHPGDAVPPPSGNVALVIRGGSTTNVGDELHLDVTQLDALGTVEYAAADDLATGTRSTFAGPLVRTVLDFAGLRGGTTLRVEALNDYVVEVPVSDAVELPLMLATRMNGKRMSVANYGPTRFIYPTEGYDLDAVTYDPRWIWQLRSIEVG